eukprot:403340432
MEQQAGGFASQQFHEQNVFEPPKELPTSPLLQNTSLDTAIQDVVFDKNIRKFVEDEKANNRIFTRQQKDVCWQQSTTIPIRDPKRWRLDPLGNPVFYTLRGCHGALRDDSHQKLLDLANQSQQIQEQQSCYTYGRIKVYEQTVEAIAQRHGFY